MKLGVIAALQTELKPTLVALPHQSRSFEHLRFHETPSLVFVVGGIGAKAAAAASLVMVDRFKPDALVSAGFCGALNDQLETGTSSWAARRSGRPTRSCSTSRAPRRRRPGPAASARSRRWS